MNLAVSPERQFPQAAAEDAEWWRGAAIYQIYPRSFQDSNGDGVGDLPGIIERLPYVAALGVEAIWISPFYRSPMLDFGYDISDYCDVDPMFGTLADFDRLLARAHELGLRVILDLVLSHTAKVHPWFVDSRSARDAAKADWYVWADAQADGTPPNNWLSLFGGSAWEWDTRRRQYYLHSFLASQPQLNFHNPEVRQAVLDVAKFWLARGVDGFRLDVVNFYFHDKQLRSNPPQDWGQYAAAVPRSNPYAFQRHLFSKTRPENLDFLRQLRALTDRYPGTTTIGEIGDDEQYRTLAAYTRGGRLHMAYTFNLMTEECSPRFVHAVLEEFLRETPDAWACWALNNHDVTRAVTRWAALGGGASAALVMLALLGSLRGSICLYQGEELGLEEARIPFEQMRDPYGRSMWPEFAGRDGCRTPMPWSAGDAHAGFSDAAPWLPIPEAHRAAAVDVQSRSPDSVLSGYRDFLAWRRRQPALRLGDMRLLDPDDRLVMFVRQWEGEAMLCAFNLSTEHVVHELPWSARPLDGHGFRGAVAGTTLSLPPLQSFFGLVAMEG